MVFRYFGRENSELSMEEVEALKIWNTTMEHIFAQAIERIEQENITSRQQIVSGDEAW